MLARLGIVEEEADESIYWLELLYESSIAPESRLHNLIQEMNEILAMVVASIKTLRIRARNANPQTTIQNR
jgi:four helix bundle protein